MTALRSGLVVAVAVLAAGCSATVDDSVEPATTGPGLVDATASPSPSPTSRPVGDLVGDFPRFPAGRLSHAKTRALQEALDVTLERGVIRGATAAVIVMGEGSWSGAVGKGLEGQALTPTSRMLTASMGKTITTAAVLRLVDEGRIGLDDPAVDHLPPEVMAGTLNGASIRDLLGMRAGFADPDGYIELVDDGYALAPLLRLLDAPHSAAGETTEYNNIYFVILAAIVEHVTGQRFADAVSSGVLDDPAFPGIRYGVKSAMAGDGWRVESDPATLARWGYELYGGRVVSPHLVHEMADFQGEFYGLGTFDLSGADEYWMPALGHPGADNSFVGRLVVFPRRGVVVSVQANTRDGSPVFDMTEALRDAARP